MGTRPSADQLRFISSANGEQIIDDYMEAAEKGGRALGDLLGELFDGSGNFTTFFQWREDPLNPGDLQYRLGSFVDPEAGWVTFTFTPYGSPEAREWADTAEDVLVSAAAGGNQIDDYSALHWAAKAAASADSFDDRYLGPKAADPTLDNDGNPLTEGAVYWNTVSKELRFYDLTNTIWISATSPPVGEAPVDGNNYVRNNAAWVQLTAPTFTGRVTAALVQDVDSGSLTGSLIVGGDGTGAHIAMDNNEIMSKAGPIGTAGLFLNFQGGLVSIGPGGLSVGGNATVGGTIDVWSAGSAIDLNAYGAVWNDGGTGLWFLNNSNYNAGWFYKNANTAARIGTQAGNIYLSVAASGLAGAAITWDDVLVVSDDVSTFTTSSQIQLLSPTVFWNGTLQGETILMSPDTGIGLNINAVTNTNVTAALFQSSIANRAVPLVEIKNNSTLGASAIGLFIEQASPGRALSILHTNTSIAAEINHNGAGGIALAVYANSGATAVDTYNAGAGVGIQGYADGGGNVAYFGQASTGYGLLIDDDFGGGTGVLLRAVANNALRTLALVELVQDHASSTASPLTIQQDGNNNAILITAGGVTTSNVLTISATNLTSGRILSVASTGALATGRVASLIQSNASATADVLYVENVGGGNTIEVIASAAGGSGIDVLKSAGTTSAAGYFRHSTGGYAIRAHDVATATAAVGYVVQVYSNNASRGIPLMQVWNDNASSNAAAITARADGGGNVVDIQPIGTGSTGINITKTSANGNAIFINTLTGASNAAISILDQSSTYTLEIDKQNAGNAIDVNLTNAAGKGAYFYSPTASRTNPLVEIFTDSNVGTAAFALRVRADNGRAVEIQAGALYMRGYWENSLQYIATTGTRDLNVANATYFYPSADLGTAVITFTFSNPAPSPYATSFTMELLGADGATLTWPTSVDWAGGTEPTWTSGRDIVSFVTRDGGVTWNGFLGGQAFA